MIESKEPYVFSTERTDKSKKKKNRGNGYSRDYTRPQVETEAVEVASTLIVEGDLNINVVKDNEVVDNSVNEVGLVLTTMKVVDASNLLNVREEPDGKILRTVKRGEQVEVVSEENGWSKLSDGSFVMSKFLK